MTSLKSSIMRKDEQCPSLNTELISIYVGNLPLSITETKLESLFKEFGVVRDVFINKKIKKDFTFGFVRYDNADSCSRAIDSMHGYRHCTHTLCVSLSSQDHSKQLQDNNGIDDRSSPGDPTSPEQLTRLPLPKNRIGLHELRSEVERQCNRYNNTFIKQRQAEGRGDGLRPIDAAVIVKDATESRYQRWGPFFRERDQRKGLDLSELARLMDREWPNRPSSSPISRLCTSVKGVDVSNDRGLFSMSCGAHLSSESVVGKGVFIPANTAKPPIRSPSSSTSPEPAVMRFAPDGASEDESRSEFQPRVVNANCLSRPSIIGKGRGAVLRALADAGGDKVKK